MMASRSWDARPTDVPNYLFGENPFVKEFGDKYRVPAAAYLGGPETSHRVCDPHLDADGCERSRQVASFQTAPS